VDSSKTALIIRDYHRFVFGVPAKFQHTEHRFPVDSFEVLASGKTESVLWSLSWTVGAYRGHSAELTKRRNLGGNVGCMLSWISQDCANPGV
jgi:hypothetical protein